MSKKVDNGAYRASFANPLVMWYPEQVRSEQTTPLMVLNPDIPLAKYSFSYDPETFIALGVTPSMQLYSMSLTRDSYQEDLQFLQDLYADAGVMQNYAAYNTDGVMLKTPEQTAARFKQLANRWTSGMPYSGFMARDANTNELIGMFNLGYAVDANYKTIPGSAEFAAVLHPDYWNHGLTSEAIIFLFIMCQALCEQDYQIARAPLQKIVASAIDDSYSDRVLQKSPLLFKCKQERMGTERNFYEAAVADINAILANTVRSQQEAGKFLPIASPKP